MTSGRTANPADLWFGPKEAFIRLLLQAGRGLVPRMIRVTRIAVGCRFELINPRLDQFYGDAHFQIKAPLPETELSRNRENVQCIISDGRRQKGKTRGANIWKALDWKTITTQKQFQEYKEKHYQDWLNANDPEDAEN